MSWIVTLVATAVSAYALDAVAAASGLVTAGVLGALSFESALVLLVASYGIWAVGLAANLRANGALLAATGTSTNVLSKAAYEATRRRGARTSRVAAAIAYAGTEVVKELPYYLAAFGAAASTDAVTSTDALVFLAGANLGAALYEYGLARLSRVIVRRRRRFASFDRDWVPGRYLADYYREVEPDEIATIAFLVTALRSAPRDEPVLFFGVGPTLHHVFAAAEVASEIHLADYLPSNLAEIQRWLDGSPDAHDWGPFVRHTLRCEGASEAGVADREELTRKKVTALLRADAREPRPLDRQYATVISAYCADSATDNLATWHDLMHNITGLVRPGGLFITAALHHCTSYTVGDHRFPSADVNADDLRAALSPDFDPLEIEIRPTGRTATHGYSSILLCWGRRSTHDFVSCRT
ncbi:guanitoxin biosynthesis pre-guanitoxin forming N-methyltransferase GntF [Asanoa sp. WMMD1127]|uniref:guanitoxin biosynthesis pre-guanitoxin forming N-methyltransferase GntF n=1 Tax=Asanoa sp. WMMD1127 TaxID=3016107 RepID=UPI00241697AA|nr:guanitoxin biosynthesis pre-guanitoxin forming N-methyltransferase GntF [Asanoa sp. WMMD1127]MDG4820273.1 guanitoxin biosynthesis pre-guanitoxin forming N-methyltransferase GntF [Asanoa sp. WMMD1127]